MLIHNITVVINFCPGAFMIAFTTMGIISCHVYSFLKEERSSNATARRPVPANETGKLAL